MLRRDLNQHLTQYPSTSQQMRNMKLHISTRMHIYPDFQGSVVHIRSSYCSPRVSTYGGSLNKIEQIQIPNSAVWHFIPENTSREIVYSSQTFFREKLSVFYLVSPEIAPAKYKLRHYWICLKSVIINNRVQLYNILVILLSPCFVKTVISFHRYFLLRILT